MRSITRESFWIAGENGEAEECQLSKGIGREEATLPKEYFDEHRSKPIINVYTVKKDDLKSLFTRIKSNIGQSTKDLKAVSAILWHFMGKIKAVLDYDWIANGQTIGKKGDTITPQFLLKANEIPLEFTVEPGDEVSETIGWTLFWALVGTYRASALPLKNDKYVEEVHKKVRRHFALSPFEADISHCTPDSLRPLQDKLEYTGLIASLDMFFNRFPKHEFASCRLGTLNSRFKACGALTSLISFAYKVNRSFADVLEHFPFIPLAKEIKRLSKDQGQDDPFSFTPYLKDMGICRISPYSSKANPLIYTLLHITGTCMGHERSMRALRVTEESQEQLLRIGVFAGMALQNFSGYEMIAASTREKLQARVKKRKTEIIKGDKDPAIVKVDAALKKGLKIKPNQKPWFRTGEGEDVHELLTKSVGIFDVFREAVVDRISYFPHRKDTIGRHVYDRVRMDKVDQ